jgi:hypothetical protein
MYTLANAGQFSGRSISRWNCELQLMREDIPISKRLRGGFMVNTDFEYMAELRYIINKNMVYVPTMIAIWALVWGWH